jgi:hypothetical protein
MGFNGASLSQYVNFKNDMQEMQKIKIMID